MFLLVGNHARQPLFHSVYFCRSQLLILLLSDEHL